MNRRTNSPCSPQSASQSDERASGTVDSSQRQKRRADEILEEEPIWNEEDPVEFDRHVTLEDASSKFREAVEGVNLGYAQSQCKV